MTKRLPRSDATHDSRAAARELLCAVGRIFGVAAVAVVLAGVALAYWAGFFDRITLDQRTIGPCNLLYRTERGPYGNVRFAMHDVFVCYRKLFGKDPERGFAIFYDTPDRIAADSLRSDVGCMTDSLVQSPVKPYLSRTMPATNAIVGSFPMRSFFSYMTGVMKFSPALEQYERKTGRSAVGPAMEIYDMLSRRIYYVAPLSAPSPEPQP